ncbi:MAG: hypothetical protein FJY20_12645 [Bacteroidetes bacterium]|nr:hypothetical protein [Bacteroidota bacterium]
MKNFFPISIFLLAACSLISEKSYSQKEKPKAVVVAEGIIVAGYVNNGGFVNFTGPSIKWVRKPTWSFVIGMLPGLRIKEDKSAAPAKKNSVITPSLGMGFTYTYKHLALQVPFYYNAKTTAQDGKWNIGFGIGYKF